MDAYSSRYSEWNFDKILFYICCSQIVYSFSCEHARFCACAIANSLLAVCVVASPLFSLGFFCFSWHCEARTFVLVSWWNDLAVAHHVTFVIDADCLERHGVFSLLWPGIPNLLPLLLVPWPMHQGLHHCSLAILHLIEIDRLRHQRHLLAYCYGTGQCDHLGAVSVIGKLYLHGFVPLDPIGICTLL